MFHEIRDYLENRINKLNAELVDILDNKNSTEPEKIMAQHLVKNRKDEIQKVLDLIEEIRDRDE